MAGYDTVIERNSFTHHDPLEDTESRRIRATTAGAFGFTHHDPLEDTESLSLVAG